jgi:4-amino-4-deoxy-L-arabinose transferase-like glycosyltransferase
MRRAIGPLTVAAAGVAMALWTWGTWPDPVTDFGKEVYLAWQLSLGRRLYVDVAYHLGPLSPLVNAAAFKLFGPSLLTIFLVNFAVLAAIAVLFYRLIARLAGPFAATVCGVVLMTLFAFVHFTPIADYNFIAPYDHAHTQGLLLGLIALTVADAFAQTRRRGQLIFTGFALGLAYLTRAEMFLAAAAGVVTLLAINRKKIPVLWIILALGAFALPILIAAAFTGLRGVAGAWPIVFNSSVTGNQFYRDSMGTLNLGESIERLAIWSACWLVIFLPPYLIGKRASQSKAVIVAAFVWSALTTLAAGWVFNPSDAFTPLPLALIVCAIPPLHVLRERAGVRVLPINQEVLPLALGALVWSFFLLLKILLNARIYHYGFALAMPATLLVISAAIGWTPRSFRAAVIGSLIVTITAYLALASSLMANQRFVVGEGANQFLADQRGRAMSQILTDLRQRASPGRTLAVMPEGAMLNFLAAMPNPTPYWSFNPPYSFFAPGQGEAAGEKKMLEALQAHPPDWVVLVKEDLTDFGTPFFGIDYGKSLYAFVQKDYVTSDGRPLGDRPFAGSDAFMLLLHRQWYNGQ